MNETDAREADGRDEAEGSEEADLVRETDVKGEVDVAVCRRDGVDENVKTERGVDDEDDATNDDEIDEGLKDSYA